MRLFFFIWILSIPICAAQTVKSVSETALDANHFVGIDSYNNTYFIKDMAFTKKGNGQTYVFNDFQLGNITTVDIINPLKIVVFYEDVNTVLLLDNQLNEIERINFNNLPEFINVSAATNASNNRLWIFNIDSQQLELFDYKNLRKIVVSQPFPGKFIGQSSNFNYCFTLTDYKLRAFNIYGSLLWEKAADGYKTLVQQNENVVVVKDNQLFYFSEEDVEPKRLEIPEITVKELQLTRDFLYIYDGKILHTFSITQPKK